MWGLGSRVHGSGFQVVVMGGYVDGSVFFHLGFSRMVRVLIPRRTMFVCALAARVGLSCQAQLPGSAAGISCSTRLVTSGLFAVWSLHSAVLSASQDGRLRVFEWPSMEVAMDVPRAHTSSLKDADFTCVNPGSHIGMCISRGQLNHPHENGRRKACHWHNARHSRHLPLAYVHCTP